MLFRSAGQTKTISFALRLRTNNLEEVVVTGTGTRYRLVDAPVATEVLTAKDIASFSAPTSEALLQGLSPSFDFGPNLMGFFMQLNGLSNKYKRMVLVRFCSRQTGKVWSAPAEVLIASAFTVTLCVAGMITASTPAHSQVRAIAPKLCTSVTPSSIINSLDRKSVV